MVKENDTISKYFTKRPVEKSNLAAVDWRDAFDAMMEGAATMLDFVGEVSYTYVTKSGNTVRSRLDSP